MIENMESPKKIYLDISNKVSEILEGLSGTARDENVSQAKKNAQDILSKLQKDIKKNIDELEKNSEWDTFTIAFYGETNAGKSTIIETLRILLNEKSKLKAQSDFKEIQVRFGITEERFLELRSSVLQDEKFIAELQDKIDALFLQQSEKKSRLSAELVSLQEVISQKKQLLSFWKRIIYLFKKLPEEIESKEIEGILKSADDDKDAEVLINQQNIIKNKKNATEENLNKLQIEADTLNQFADGAIIGDGRPDFTLNAQPYHFELGSQKFALLDVPGIEGKESKVAEAVLSAVQKAHAVFYVTSKAGAPQKGDANNKGTLEKIKEQLGAQTEVWTIFNKRINNPVQLKKSSLIDEGEQESLQVLDGVMREQLGKNYQKTISLSAQPAFLAVASCLTPGSQNAKSKDKLLSQFSVEELLKKSEVHHFKAFLSDNLVINYKDKIMKSNFNKANKAVMNLIHELDRIHETEISPLQMTLKPDALAAQQKLDLAFEKIKKNLESRGVTAVDDFENNIRERVYSKIREDISNGDFKSYLERCIRTEQQKLEENLPVLINDELTRFKSEISGVINKFKQHASELLKSQSDMKAGKLHSGFDIKINIDSGMKVSNLLGALVGAGLMIWNPAGVVLMAISAVTIFVSIVKAVRSFFSTDYKMTQQRKAVNENLANLSDTMNTAMQQSLLSALPELEIKIAQLKNAIQEPVKQLAEMSVIFLKSKVELLKLSKQIEV